MDDKTNACFREDRAQKRRQCGTEWSYKHKGVQTEPVPENCQGLIVVTFPKVTGSLTVISNLRIIVFIVAIANIYLIVTSCLHIQYFAYVTMKLNCSTM